MSNFSSEIFQYLLENLEEMFPLYYVDSDILSTYLNIQSHFGVLPVMKGLSALIRTSCCTTDAKNPHE